jgi:hypothetical protein
VTWLCVKTGMANQSCRNSILHQQEYYNLRTYLSTKYLLTESRYVARDEEKTRGAHPKGEQNVAQTGIPCPVSLVFTGRLPASRFLQSYHLLINGPVGC